MLAVVFGLHERYKMQKKQFDIPVLFIIFNRPDVTQVVFNRIREVKPKYLFVAADGPREGVTGELEQCNKTRKIIEQIDWDCEVKTLFRDKNLGCGKGVSSAITWFFDNVEQGIILEDDCLPDLTFFDFTALMLEKYKNEDQVKMISGTNYLFNKVKSKESYYFSKYYSIWGWATWKRAWNQFDFEIKSWPKVKLSGEFKRKLNFSKYKMNKFWASNLDSVYNKKIDTWDIQWAYTCFLNDGLSISPINNLVSNLGAFGAHGDGDVTFINMPTKKLDINNIVHPKSIEVTKKLDKISYKNIGITKFNLHKKVWRMRFGVYALLKKMLFIQK